MRLGTSSTNSRNSSGTRRYRTVAPTSQVDETLFGSQKQLDKHENSASKAQKNQSQRNQEREAVQIVTKDLVRNLRIPFKDPTGQFIILPPAEFKRITSASRVLTKEESEALSKAHQRKKEEDILANSAAAERKRQIYEADLSRKENQALTELEIEAQSHARYLVERASALRMEQEEEIKELNKLILDAQCQATRDAQIQERGQIQAELSEEEKRLDTMMEVERRKALEMVEQIDEMRRQQRIRGKQQICDQIQQRLEESQVQEEMKEQEKQQIKQKQEKMIQEDLKALEKKREEQQQLQEEIKRINNEIMRVKEQRREDEKLADLKVLEYTQNKMVREAEYEAEQRRIKKEKELEIARLRAQQEKARDYKAEQDELRARRNQEVTEREWRRKEKEMNVKKAQDKAMLVAALAEQVQCKEHFLSMEAGREKAEFERLLKVQQEAILKQKEEDEKQRQKAQRHGEAIRTQVRKHVLSAIEKRRQIFKEANQLSEEARLRRIRLDEMKEKKLKELKATGLPEKYCSEVEKKAWTSAL